jgi:hypothetical protein
VCRWRGALHGAAAASTVTAKQSATRPRMSAYPRHGISRIHLLVSESSMLLPRHAPLQSTRGAISSQHTFFPTPSTGPPCALSRTARLAHAHKHTRTASVLAIPPLNSRTPLITHAHHGRCGQVSTLLELSFAPYHRVPTTRDPRRKEEKHTQRVRARKCVCER